MYTIARMSTYQMEELVRPDGVKPEVLAVRMRWESKECVRAFAKDMGLSLSDSVRLLLRDGLKANGY